MSRTLQSLSGTEGRVCLDIAERQRLGINKYGTTVEQNPLALREWMQHAYEEGLDLSIYLRRAMEEMDRPRVCGNCKHNAQSKIDPLGIRCSNDLVLQQLFGEADFHPQPDFGCNKWEAK